jgi:hypothetical protein
MIIASYAEMLLEKFKRLAGDIDSEEIQMNKFEQFEIDVDNIKFEEVLFLRVLYEFSKSFRKDRSIEFMEKIDEIVPDF